MSLEKVIYGPDGRVARRLAVQAPKAVPVVTVDRDSRKTHVQHHFDAQPALDMAHAVRSELGAWSAGGSMRRMGVMPEPDYYHMVWLAKREAKQAGAGSYREILRRKMRAYFEERPYLKT